jgi:PAS domain-containing protein
MTDISIHECVLPYELGPPAVKPAWQGVLDSIPVAAYTCDAAGLITYFNRQAVSVWGRTVNLRDITYRYWLA